MRTKDPDRAVQLATRSERIVTLAAHSSVYAMRMTRVNITVPDDLLGRAKAAGLNVSRLAAAALEAELERRAKVAELDAYLADLDAEFGPIPPQESVAAREWADQVLTASSGGADAARGARRA